MVSSVSIKTSVKCGPRSASRFQICRQIDRYSPKRTGRESIVLPQVHRPNRAAQVEHGLVTRSDYMDVRRTVIVGVDHDSQALEMQTRSTSLICTSEHRAKPRCNLAMCCHRTACCNAAAANTTLPRSVVQRTVMLTGPLPWTTRRRSNRWPLASRAY